MDEVDYRNLVSLIANKKNVILQGAPGVGKTFVAKRLAYSIMGEKNRERVMMIQFHLSYSKELRKLLVLLSDVDSIDIYSINWYFRYDRSNQTYRMQVSVCYLVI